jgi:hypothetical protein
VGATKLRTDSSGRERVVGQPILQQVFAQTEIGVTRHEVDPHRTDDHAHWFQKTLEMNRRYLDDSTPRAVAEHANRGSQRQVQAYVNSRPDELSEAILDRLPPRQRELRAAIRWVSPLAREN